MNYIINQLNVKIFNSPSTLILTGILNKTGWDEAQPLFRFSQNLAVYISGNHGLTEYQNSQHTE